MPSSEFRLLTAGQIEALSREKTVFFFAVGPLEDHGPHLPVGMDLLEAEKCCALAVTYLEETLPGWTGIVMPAAPLGIDSNTTKIAITVRPHVLRDWLVDACLALIRLGFFHFVCFSGHRGPKQLTAIEEAGKIIRREVAYKKITGLFNGQNNFPTLISANSALVSFKEVMASPFWPDPPEHGGQRDTSVAQIILPNDTLAAEPNQTQISSRWKRNWLRRRHKLQGYWGNPNEAKPELGQAALQAQVNDLFPKMRAVWEGKHPDRLFRSWYSILPLNKSFFKAWLLVFWICILMIGYQFLRGAALHF